MNLQLSGEIFTRFQREFSHCWQRLPNKTFFFLLAAAWLALFHFLGNSTLGYIRSPSLPYWMCVAFASGDLLQSDDAYGAVIPFGVLILFWMKRRELLALELRPWWPASLLVGSGLVIHTIGYLIQQPRVSIVALFLGLYGLMGLAWGPAWLRASFFPFCLFVFCIPLGSLATPITFRLRLLVCHLVQTVSHLFLAIDVVRDGTILRDPTGRYEYEVAAACSGLRSLTAIIALAIILAFLFCRTWWKRLVMLAAAIPLAILGNCLRMLAIIVAAAIGGPDWGRKVHEGGPGGILVVLLYLPAVVGLLMLEHYLRERPPPVVAEPLAPESKADSIPLPARAADKAGLRFLRHKGALAALVMVLIAADAGLLLWLHTPRLGLPGVKTHPVPGSDRLVVELPERVLDYTSKLIEVDATTQSTLPPDTSFGQRHYQAPDGSQLDLKVVLMGTDRTSLHQPQFCVRGQGWDIDQNQSLETRLPMNYPDSSNLPVVKFILKKQAGSTQPGPSRAVYVYWYVADGAVSSSISGFERMWLMTRGLLLTGVLQRWAYVTCTAFCKPGEEQATFDRAKQFITAAVPEFQQMPR